MTVGEASPAYAGFLRRLIAGIVDGILIAVVNIVLFLMFKPDLQAFAGLRSADEDTLLYTVLCMGFIGGYYTILESGYLQATLGKQLVRIYVTSVDGGALSPFAAFLRAWPFWIAGLALLGQLAAGLPSGVTSILQIIALVACLAMVLTKRKQGLHDLMARALVVRGWPHGGIGADLAGR